MKAFHVLSTCLASGLFLAGNVCCAASGIDQYSKREAISAAFKAASTRVPFIKNQGQIRKKEVSYYARLFSGTLFVTEDGALVYSIGINTKDDKKGRWAFRESFLGRNSSQPLGAGQSVVQVSEFKGNKSSVWRNHLPTYERIDLGEVYPGIRASLRATGNNVEKLFYVAPGAKASDIKIAVQGIQAAMISVNNQLQLKTGAGDIAYTAPVAYQEIDGQRRNVPVAYALTGTTYGFKLGDYDPSYELVIDPLLASTYLGGINANPPQYSNYDEDIAYSVVAAGDSVYLGGVTQSTDFPIVLGYDDTPNASGSPDGFIARFSSDLTTLYSSTYFGTEYFDRVSAIAMDTDGTIVAVGQAGYGFPVTAGAYNYQGSEPVGGGFVAKFSADLSTLVASAVVTPSDYPVEVAVGNGGIYFAGSTNNPGFPITSNAFLSTCCPAGGFGIRDYDGFAGKISSDLSTLDALTYLGGNNVTGIAIAPDSSVYLSDGVDSAITGYLSHFDADLTTRLAQVSYYPGTTSGSSRHYFNDVAVGDGFVVAVGQTYLNDLPVTAGAFDTACGSDGNCDDASATLYIPKPDGFVARYSPDLQTVQAMTYFGGNGADSIRSVDLDSAGNVYIAGETVSTDMPTTGNAHDNRCGTDGACNPSGPYGTPAIDVFTAKLSSDLSQLVYGSYLGGSTHDFAYQLALNTDGSVFVAGKTDSADFPTTSGAFDRSYAGGASGTYDSDAFVSQFDMSGGGGSGGSGGSGSGSNTAPVADAGSDQSVGPRQTVYLDGRGSTDSDGRIVQYRWTKVSGKRVTINNADRAVASFVSPFVRRGQSKTLVFELTVTDDQGASAMDEVAVIVTR